MTTDPFENLLGFEPGNLAWQTGWCVVAAALVALGGLLYWLVGRFHQQMEPEVEDESAAPSGWRVRGEVLVPGNRFFLARKAMVHLSQVLFLVLFVDIALHVLLSVFENEFSSRMLANAEAILFVVVGLRVVHWLTRQTSAGVAHLQTLEDRLFVAWRIRDVQVLSAQNVTGVAIACLRLLRFTVLLFVYYWAIAFVWFSLELGSEDIRPTLMGLIFAIVIWQAFIWFDRIFPFLDDVVDGWEGSILRSIPIKGHAFITEQHSTQVFKTLLLLLRIAVSASFFATFCIYVLETLPIDQSFREEIRIGQYVLVTTATAWILFRGLAGLRGIFELRLPQWKGTLIQTWKYQRTDVFTAHRLVGIYTTFVKWGFLSLSAVLAYFYATVVFSFFEKTQNWADGLVGNIKRPFVATLLAIWNYLPHLLAVVVIFLVARTITRVVRWFFEEIERENIRFSGFYPEWAMATYQLVRMVIVIFTFIAIFPHLPGADTAQFRGISVFIGLVVSLGGSGTVGHAVSGVMLTYMRPFNLGDRVRIGDTVGNVVDKTILVTRVRTSKNVDITIPNGTVLGSHIINYSAMASGEGVIVHTAVTLGYNVPWRDIHDVMLGAARATEGIAEEPPPFVLQTALDDHYVHYEINGYTKNPDDMPQIYSDLHARMQDEFAQAGIEILSPVYEAARDGSAVAIPNLASPGTDEE